jgi:hypothetical protein
VRRVRRKHPEQARKTKLMDGFACKDEMPNVRRVKRAAKKADLCS